MALSKSKRIVIGVIIGILLGIIFSNLTQSEESKRAEKRKKKEAVIQAYIKKNAARGIEITYKEAKDYVDLSTGDFD